VEREQLVFGFDVAIHNGFGIRSVPYFLHNYLFPSKTVSTCVLGVRKSTFTYNIQVRIIV